jgi:D-3-phosphoglycerate dehydrogenase / 2-oxoglutarate reductase
MTEFATSVSGDSPTSLMTSSMKVLVREPIAAAGIELLRERFNVDIDSESDLEERIGLYDALIVRSGTKVTAELIDRAERLKVIGRAGVGIDNVDVAAATRRGIVVANAPQSTVISAAEHTIALLLALARNVPQAHAALREGRWERSRFGGIELAGKTLGIVGFGRIGQQVARRARALEMRVVAYDPYVAPDRFRALGAEHASELRALLGIADFLTLHLTLTEETRGLLGREEFAAAKPGVRVVNVARGELVDEDALAEALRDGRVAGAALDVFSAEPYSGPLLELPNVVVTPHLGASTEEAQDRAGVIVAEQVCAALEGRVVTNAVNMPAVAPEELERLRPYLPLAGKLAALAVELAGGNPKRLDLEYLGALAEEDTRLLTVAALNGVFHGRVETINYVNAPLVAAERGLEVREESSSYSPDFTSVVSVTAHAAGQPAMVAGTVSGRSQRGRLVQALGYAIEVELDRLMLFAENDDRPGMIGALGRILGEAGINIANMAVSRDRREARALMALSLDSQPPAEVLERLRAEPGFVAARFLVLPEA